MSRLREIKRNLKRYLELYKSLYKDKRTPRRAKAFLWLAFAYLAMPLDIIPDFIPVLGQLDDLVIVPALLYASKKSIPRELYRKHYKKIFGKA